MKHNFLFNNSSRKPQRFIQRRKMTPTEKLIWKFLSRKQLGYWFKRQVSIGPYFVDFYCPAKRLVIEIDGIQHLQNDAKEYDLFRTKYLNGLNIQVIRFGNHENINEIVNKIKVICRLSPPRLGGVSERE